jgi:fibronectin type 3 domain-containing protein
VDVYWKAPAVWSDGTPVDAHLVYVLKRNKVGSERWDTVVEGYDGTHYHDRKPEPSSVYVYKVAAVYDYEGTVITGMESAVSNPASRLDTEAPDAPEHVTAMKSEHGVVIRWDASVAPDVFGYNVYRTAPSGITIRINRTPVILNRFVDDTRLLPGTYLYAVTAVDNSHNANESPMSAAVSITIR